MGEKKRRSDKKGEKRYSIARGLLGIFCAGRLSRGKNAVCGVQWGGGEK